MKKTTTFILIASISGILLLSPLRSAYAEPYGLGQYSANVSYGSQTSLTISTGSSGGGNVALTINPSNTGSTASAASQVSVYSTDVVGYNLYIEAVGSSAMTNGSRSIPASANTTAAALSPNTWGYNLDGSTNFLGVKTTNTLIHTLSGPAENGDVIPVTFGLNVDNTVAPGQYQATVMYTAVPQTN